MWFERFSQLIDQSPIGAVVESRKKILEETDPRHIYIENVRHFFGVPHSVAKGLLEIGVREGLFLRCEGIRCPNDDRIVEEACGEERLPEHIHCYICEELDMNADFPTANCKRLTFYRLRDEGN